MSKKAREFDKMVTKDENNDNIYVFDKEKYSKGEVLFKVSTKLETGIISIAEGCAKFTVCERDYTLCECGDGGAFPVWIAKDGRKDVIEEVIDSLNKKEETLEEFTGKFMDKFADSVGIPKEIFKDKPKEPKFKVGDRVKLIKGSEFTDRIIKESKRVNNHKITKIVDDCFYYLDNTFSVCFISNDLELIEEKEHEFKVGDKVKWNGSTEEFTVYMDEDRKSFLKSKEEHILSYVDEEDNTCLLMDCPYWFCTEWFDKVEAKPIAPPAPFPYNLQKGEVIQVSSYEDMSQSNIFEKFYKYDADLEKPFLTIDADGDVTNWLYTRRVPKYKAYTKPKLEWLGKELRIKETKSKRKITGITLIDDVCHLDFNNRRYETLASCFELMEELDGKPFGEIIK